MEESELDEWFTERKERLEQTFAAAVLENKKADQAKQTFDHEYRALIATYQKKQRDLYEHRVRMAALQTPINRVKEHLVLFMQRIKQWCNARFMGVKAWFFHQKIKRILRDRHA